jgi:hypothetical protein
MSAPNKSLDKNKRYAGVKTNDFVNKTRANEANRTTGMSYTKEKKFLTSFFFLSSPSRLGKFRKN